MSPVVSTLLVPSEEVTQRVRSESTWAMRFVVSARRVIEPRDGVAPRGTGVSFVKGLSLATFFRDRPTEETTPSKRELV